jgi:hypothetical protein
VTRHKDKDFKAFVMFQNETPERLEAMNKAVKADNVALTLLKNDDEALQGYKINPEAKNTVIVYKQRKATAVFPNFDPKKDAARLQQAIADATR